MLKSATTQISVCRVDAGEISVASDLLVVEEPLEIQLGYSEADVRLHRSISVTMRTPGDDADLAAGFLFTEGIIRSQADIARIFHAGAPLANTGTRNTLRIDLCDGIEVDLKRLERHFYISSSCGVCGKTSLEAVQTLRCSELSAGTPQYRASVIHEMPDTLRRAQAVFDHTGGLHAAAFFDASGALLSLREDVGRHNAVDKLIGAELLAGRLPVNGSVLFVSGRASFELVQKAIAASVPVLAAVGAPSSLAVELAREHGMTLLGFVRSGRFNIYTGAERIREAAGAQLEGEAQCVRAQVV
jgi:FdhD protein